MRRIASRIVSSSSSTAPTQRRSCATASVAINLFRGKLVLGEILPYPVRIMSTEEGENLETLVRHIQGVETATGEAQTADSTAAAAPRRRGAVTSEQLIEWGAAGAAIATEFGGLQLSETAHCVAVEEMVHHCSVSTIQPLLPHVSIATYLIKHAASRENKAKYLGGMSDATIRMGWAVTERLASTDVCRNKAKAVPQGDGSYRITGTKVVHGASTSTHFLVLARTPTQVANPDGVSPPLEATKATFFVVKKDTPGVSIAADGSVTFTDALAEDIIGAVGEGHVNYMVALHTSHHIYSAAMLGLAKRAFRIAKSAAAGEGREVLQTAISNAAVQLYGMESMLYALTANIDKPTEDCLVEATLCASFIQEVVPETLRSLVDAAAEGGADGAHLAQQAELQQVLQEVRKILRLTEPIEVLRSTAACCGIEDFGLVFQKTSTLQVMQVRLGRSLGIIDKVPVQNWPEVEPLNALVVTFSEALRSVVTRYGPRLSQMHAIHNRTALAASLIYSSLACIARVSMVTNKKMPSAKFEKTLATLYISQSIAWAERLCGEIAHSGKTADEIFKRTALESVEDACQGVKMFEALPPPPPAPAAVAAETPKEDAPKKQEQPVAEANAATPDQPATAAPK